MVKVSRYTEDPSGFRGSVEPRFYSSSDEAISLIKEKYERMKKNASSILKELEIKHHDNKIEAVFDIGGEYWSYTISPVLDYSI